ncbi:hypothetical protein GA0116948_10847 [Chitinophaga costaii]|uniref:DUF4397 domain-containing protein n=1 Tax=Chitinophaga costaii TaxID=1335309 RepID=A0A1C4EEA0_9BACT|nr:hypothetical protein [Chitinophaga costaii]PUZ23879.1 hypothetical protein DCM91_13895 [Chitinophaga costaii]SCC41956.1 hypothetical protein GA0116948_10847 [Chitinophaga costaii]
MIIKQQWLFLLLAVACLAACTKTVDKWSDKKADTVRDTLTTLSDSRIIAFKVRNTGEVNIQGAINDSARTITVYLPYFYQLQFLEVNVTLPEGASIFPTSDSLVPVFDTAKILYTVTGKSGSKTTYTVQPVIQQAYLQLNELSSATNTAVFNIAGAGAALGISGTNILPSYSVTSLYLIDKGGKEVYKFHEFENATNSTTNMSFSIGKNDKALFLPDTDYWLELRSYTLSSRTQYPIRFVQ